MVSFDLSELDAADESHFVAHTTEKVRWVWVYAGPGHPKTIEVSDRRAKKRLQEDRLKEQAVVNGKKWKADDMSVDDAKEEIVRIATERLLGWHLEDVNTGERLSESPTLDGRAFPFSEENARAFLREPRRVGVLNKALEWLGDEASFTPRSATPSGGTLSAPSNSTDTKKGAPAEIA